MAAMRGRSRALLLVAVAVLPASAQEGDYALVARAAAGSDVETTVRLTVRRSQRGAFEVEREADGLSLRGTGRVQGGRLEVDFAPVAGLVSALGEPQARERYHASYDLDAATISGRG